MALKVQGTSESHGLILRPGVAADAMPARKTWSTPDHGVDSDALPQPLDLCWPPTPRQAVQERFALALLVKGKAGDVSMRHISDELIRFDPTDSVFVKPCFRLESFACRSVLHAIQRPRRCMCREQLAPEVGRVDFDD